MKIKFVFVVLSSITLILIANLLAILTVAQISQQTPILNLCKDCLNGCHELLAHGNYEEAQLCYEKALGCCNKSILQKPNDAVCWYHRGNSLHMLGRYEDAIGALNKATELDSQLKYAWNEKGVILNQLGNFSEALNCFDKAIKIDSQTRWAAAPWNNKGRALEALGRISEANDAKAKANELENTSNSLV